MIKAAQPDFNGFEVEVMKSTNLREMREKESTTGAVTPLNTELSNRHSNRPSCHSLVLRNDLSPPQIPGLKDLVRFAMHGAKHYKGDSSEYGYYKGERVPENHMPYWSGSGNMPAIRESHHENDSTSEEVPSMDIQHPYDGFER